jgi:copper chaperone NosL
MRADLRNRLLMTLAALLLIPAFYTPLWRIGLVAPQYPDGLGMDIYVHDVRGRDRHDIQNINILNHYIGMKEIDPATIPELEIMPKVLGALVVSGVVVGVVGSPVLMGVWLVVFLGAGTAGMVDFYLWNIDYGHNLSPDAPIRIPGMTYSPPILGTAQLLNIRASSWPGLGTGFLTLSALLAGLATVGAFRERRHRRGAPRAAMTLLPLLLPLAALAGCDPNVDAGDVSTHREGVRGGQARPVVTPPLAPQDSMDFDRRAIDPYCLVEVETIRWGGTLELKNGERLPFASASCLAAFVAGGFVAPEQIERIRVVDFSQGWKLVDAPSARFLLTPNLKTPAGTLNVLAVETDRLATSLQEAYSGRLISWEELLRLTGPGASGGAG